MVCSPWSPTIDGLSEPMLTGLGSRLVATFIVVVIGPVVRLVTILRRNPLSRSLEAKPSE